MFTRNWHWGMVLIAGSALVVAGCSSVSARRQAEAAKPAKHTGLKRVELDDISPEKAAEAHAHFGAGVIHEMNNEPAAALEEYYKAARLDPGNETLVLEVSRRFLQSKEFDKALEIVNRAASQPKASGAIFARLGLIYAELGKTEQSVAANRTAIKKDPTLLAGYRNLFLVYLQTKQAQQAVSVLDEAARQPGAEPEFLLGISEMYVSLSLQVPAQKEAARTKALGILDRVAKANPRGPILRMALADTYNALGETTKAARFYLDLLKELKDAPLIRERVHAKLTEIYLRTSDRKRAVEHLQAILEDDPTNPAAHYYLGTLAFDEKKWAEAADQFKQTVVLNPDFEQAYYDLASAQLDLDKASDALATLGKARQKFARNGQNFVLELLTGLAYTRDKDYTRALEHFTAAEVAARATDPKRLNQFFYFQLGATYERKGDYTEAEKNFKKCLELAPDFAQALNYLGYMWAEHDQNLEQAREMIEKALKAEPKNGAYLDSLGWVFFKLHQPKKALDCVLKASQALTEPDPTVFDHLGDIYTALKEPEKAREAWRKALAIEPSEAIRKKLEGGVPQSAGDSKTEAQKAQP